MKPPYTFRSFFIVGSILFFATSGFSQNNFDSCILEAIKNASPEVTIGELKAQCRTDFPDTRSNLAATKSPGNEEQEYAFSDRLMEDDKNVLRPFSLMAHKPNYILLGTYNNNGFDPALYQKQDQLYSSIKWTRGAALPKLESTLFQHAFRKKTTLLSVSNLGFVFLKRKRMMTIPI